VFILAARLSRAPIVLHLHGGGYAAFYESAPAALRLLIRTVLGEASRIIVLTEAFRSQFRFLRDDGERIVVVPNGSPVPLAAPRPAPGGGIRLLFLSNLLVEKGYQDVVAAFPLLRQRLPDGFRISLVLGGNFSLGKDGFRDVAEMKADLHRRIAELGLADIVRHVGLVEDRDKQRVLDDADLFLLPTYYENEGQPLALIEALSRGLPVISTAWRGLGDMVTDGANGLIVPPRSPDAIAAAVARLACDAALYERCSAAAIETARRFTREIHVGRMAEVLEGAIRSRSIAA
jgi:glycosyltransferase involved in cell wall biosynthesis